MTGMGSHEEEAIKAKAAALKKMENKDFSGARKLAIKAQQLNPYLENISQMICVCDVHCHAYTINMGNDKDWYGILQVHQSADENLIMKQYSKLARLLRPDKNKLPGAAAAFKLIGEAQRILLDREKRYSFDMRHRAFYQGQNWHFNNVWQPWGHNVPQPVGGAGAFWTFCPHARVALGQVVPKPVASECGSNLKRRKVEYGEYTSWPEMVNDKGKKAKNDHKVISPSGLRGGEKKGEGVRGSDKEEFSAKLKAMELVSREKLRLEEVRLARAERLVRIQKMRVLSMLLGKDSMEMDDLMMELRDKLIAQFMKDC